LVAPPAPEVPPVPLHVPGATHAAPHCTVPAGHAHAPFVHTLPFEQTVPHVPQFV
jgi:hypothetical protein